jgi:hypothetical protein
MARSRWWLVRALKAKTLFLTATFCLVGAASFAGVLTKLTRFYPGEPLRRQDVAFVFATMGCEIDRIFDVEETGVFRRETAGGELLPGYYELCVSYRSTDGVVSQGLVVTSSVGCFVVAANLLAGHVYAIAPRLSATGWQAELFDVTTEADRRAGGAQSWWVTEMDKSVERVGEYFAGARAACTIAGLVVERQKSRLVELGTLAGAWSQVQAGNVVDIVIAGKHKVAVVDSVSDSTLAYHLPNDDIPFVVARQRVESVAVVAQTFEEYAKPSR